MSTVIDKPITLPVQLEGEFQILLAKTFSLEPEWLKKKRKDAFDSFCNTGIPARKNEEYKYTDVKKVFSEVLQRFIMSYTISLIVLSHK